MSDSSSKQAKVHTASDYDKFKTIIEPNHIDVSSICLQQCQVATIGQLDFAHSLEDNAQDITVINPYAMRDKESRLVYTTGAHAFALLLSHRLKVAISKFNMCDANI
jgi:hypothetical protein